MGDSAREHAQALEPLRLLHLRLQLPARRLGLDPLGHILDGADYASGLAVLPSLAVRDDLDATYAPVRSHDPVLHLQPLTCRKQIEQVVGDEAAIFRVHEIKRTLY